MYDFQFYYVTNSEPQNVLHDLYSQGFDVIMVNHPTYDNLVENTGQSAPIDDGAYYM